MRRRAWFVHLQFEVGRFVQESCGNLGVRCCFSQPKQDRRLTHEVLFSDHLYFPRGIPAPMQLLGNWAFVPSRKYKSELMGAVWNPSRAVAFSNPCRAALGTFPLEDDGPSDPPRWGRLSSDVWSRGSR